MNYKNILVTGGAGFIGCNVVDKFLAMDCNVSILDNLSRAGSEKNFAWLMNNMTTPLNQRVYSEFKQLRSRQRDLIYHLLHNSRNHFSSKSPEDFEVNAWAHSTSMKPYQKNQPLLFMLN
jgi:CDP-paratose 2-epimerase